MQQLIRHELDLLIAKAIAAKALQEGTALAGIRDEGGHRLLDIKTGDEKLGVPFNG